MEKFYAGRSYNNIHHIFIYSSIAQHRIYEHKLALTFYAHENVRIYVANNIL